MAIRVERIRADIEVIARCTATPGNGATRPTFSAAWKDARQYLFEQLDGIAGCEVITDRGGNLHARQSELGWDAPAWLCGSHTDTVPHGGNYDGVAGVVVALELLRSAKEEGIVLPLEVVDFAEEEGPTFGLGMIGSRTWVGEIGLDKLMELVNSAGQSYYHAGREHGVWEPGVKSPSEAPHRYLGLIEVHIEQGPGLWRRDQRLAVVTAIAGRNQYRVTLGGEANHAGATAMSDRRDALAGAAEIVSALEALAPALSPQTVITVGRLICHPNAVNVIADRVEFTIDFRAPADATLQSGDAMLRATLQEIARRRKLSLQIEQTEAAPARPMNEKLVSTFSQMVGGAPAISGALHDSAILAPHLPTVMLFVPSKDGISHNPAEFSRVEDIAAAAEIVQRVVRRPTLARLSAMDQKTFIATIGHVFEHSPWIAERAWPKRPFASLADLHEKLRMIVASATPAEQEALIKAHPDLVGRLAEEGQLTRESTAEQAAAGLSQLTPDEVTNFERYNAAYRERFGFPFVICARENKKEAILAAFPMRLQNSRGQEIETALAEIYKIAALRLADAVWE
jgi:allantoate deiminase